MDIVGKDKVVKEILKLEVKVDKLKKELEKKEVFKKRLNESEG